MTNRQTAKKDEEDNKKRIIIMIIIIIIIILLLLTSCSCTSKFFGKIGDLFKNEGEHIITPGTNDKEVIRNKNLKFDVDSATISISDTNAKVSFTMTNIDLTNITCVTSDAEIATCYVEDNFVIINPKKEGVITLTIQGEDNNKIYEATSTITITGENRYLKLSSNNGIINLAGTPFKNVNYLLVGISGEVKAISSNENVATVTIHNGYLTINGKNVGNADIKVSVECNGILYEVTYKLQVINQKYPIDDPSNPDIPVGPSDPVISEKDNDSSLKYLSTNFEEIKLLPNTYTYQINVGSNINKISLIAIPNSDKATLSYQPLNSLNNIILHPGINRVYIKVTAEDGSSTTYEVIINKEVSKNPLPSKIEIPKEENIYLESIPYLLPFAIYDENGNEITDYNLNDISISFPSFNGKYSIEKGYISILPNNSMLNQTATLVIKYKNIEAETKLNFKSLDYFVKANPNKYDVILRDTPSTKDIIINTNLFNGQIEVTRISNGIRITSKTNSNLYLDVTSQDDNITAIKYNGESNSPTYLPISVTVNKEGSANIKVALNAFDKQLDSTNIELNIIKEYKIVINANGGIFNSQIGSEYITYTSNSIDLSQIPKPVKKDENDECHVYKFKGYSISPTGPIIYQGIETIKDISSNMTLYAIYSSTPTLDPYAEEETIWIKNIDLFYSQEYFEKYNKPKMIYPGAAGYYIEYLTNDTGTDIALTGIIIKEDNICVTEGCLNMGYIIRYRDYSNNQVKDTYYYGRQETYHVLNNGQSGEKLITFDDDQIIEVKKDAKAEITIFWKWIEESDSYMADSNASISDKVDTLIGNQAADLNNLYSLYLGFNYKKVNPNCVD